MADEITRLENPIDTMYLIHKALRAEANRAEKVVGELEIGGSLQGFKLAFNSWATALMFHSEMEDEFITHPLSNGVKKTGSDKQNSSNGLAIDVKAAIVAQEEELHRELLETVEEVLEVLNEEIGKTSIIERTKQHLYIQVMSLRMAQEDHLETEEALVLPLVREQMNDQEQLEVIKGLLTDEIAEDPRWVIDWVYGALDPKERELLSEIEARFSESSTSVS